MKPLLILFLIVNLASLPLLAQTPDPDATELQSYASLMANPHEAWLTEPWTDDNTPYMRSRQTLDALNNKHLITVGLMNGYRLSYLEHKDDPKEAFRWAYATYLMLHSTVVFPHEDIAHSAILDRFPKPSPKTYDYARLRFLLAVQGIAKPKYKEIAARLYKHDPNDVKITASYARVLSMTNTQEDKQKALSLARKLIRQDPNDSKHETLLGSIYFISWYSAHEAQDRILSIQAYQAFLRMAPRDDPFRSQAVSLINLLKNP